MARGIPPQTAAAAAPLVVLRLQRSRPRTAHSIDHLLTRALSCMTSAISVVDVRDP